MTTKAVIDYIKLEPEFASTMLSDMDELPIIKLGDFTLQLELEELKPEYKEIARNELRENPDIAKPAIEELRSLLKEIPNLHVPLDNDLWLTRFLRPCKYYPQSASELIQRYYKFKVKHNKLYDGLSPSNEQNIFKQNILTVMPNRDQHGRRILLIELGKKWDTSTVSLDEVFKGCVLFLEIAMLEPQTQVAGAVVMFDMDGLTLQQTTKFTPSFAKLIVDFLQESVPLRIKNLHVVNQPFIFKIVFALFKPFLREKLKSRLIFHGTDRKSLHQYVDKDCLPECYGGTVEMPRIDGDQWLELLLKCDKEYKAISSYGYDKKIEK